jgi:hypothetical protein
MAALASGSGLLECRLAISKGGDPVRDLSGTEGGSNSGFTRTVKEFGR